MVLMSKNIIRVKKCSENPFIQVYKYPIDEDNRLSFKAKGILTYLLGKPDDWQVYQTEIEKHASDGKASVDSGIKELIEYGYMDRKQRRDDKGRFKGYDYTVYEVPPGRRKSDFGLSDNGKPATTNNDVSNIDCNNNKDNTYI